VSDQVGIKGDGIVTKDGCHDAATVGKHRHLITLGKGGGGERQLNQCSRSSFYLGVNFDPIRVVTTTSSP
jgi:hypothetical protein